MNSGDVVVGKIGDDLRMDHTAQGLTVGLAARMQELAEPGKVYMTASTAALVSGYFELEDLHGFDAGSEAFLFELIDAAPGSHRVLLLSFRPEYRADWMKKSFYQHLSVAPLGPEAIDPLLQYPLGGDASLRALGEIIRERTGGNPFFVEELVHDLAESGVLEGTRGSYRIARPIQQASVPSTVTAVIGVRIDRLPETEKRVLQTAAVIGRSFTEPVLQRVTDASDLASALAALESTEFIFQGALYPEATYAFKHVLTQEVAYASQLAERRARVREAVARTIEELDSEHLDERAALLAYHWEGAGQALEAARWHRRAAVRAGGAHPSESMRHWRPIIELLAEVPSTDETAELGVMARNLVIRDAGGVGAPEAEVDALHTETRTLADHGVPARSRVILENAYGFVKGLSGRLEEGRRAVEEAARLAEGLDDTELRAATGYTRMALILLRGAFHEGNTLTQEMMELSESDPLLGMETMGASLHRVSRAWRGWSLCELGDPGAGEFVRRAVESLTDDRDALATALTHRSSVHWGWVVGDGVTALASARKVLQLAETIETPTVRAWAMLDLGTAHPIDGRWDDAIDALESIRRDLGAQEFMELWSLPRLACAYRARGEHVRARETAELAIRLCGEWGMRVIECEGHLVLARTRVVEEGALDEPAIGATLDRAADLIEVTGSRRQLPEIHGIRAAVAKRKSDAAACNEQLSEAQRLYTEMGATRKAERVAREIAGQRG